MAKIEGTVALTGTVTVGDTNDTYAIAWMNQIRGGIHSAADTSARDAIPQDRLQEGMLCFLEDTKTYSQYVNGAWADFEMGGAAEGGIANLKAVESATNLDTVDTNTFNMVLVKDENKIYVYHKNDAEPNKSEWVALTDSDTVFESEEQVDTKADLTNIQTPTEGQKVWVREEGFNYIYRGVDTGWVKDTKVDDISTKVDDLVEKASIEIPTKTGLDTIQTPVAGQKVWVRDEKANYVYNADTQQWDKQVTEDKVGIIELDTFTDATSIDTPATGQIIWVRDEKKYYIYDEVDQEWKAKTSSEGSTYSTTEPTTTAVGGIPKGTEYIDTPITEVLDQLLHPYQVPTFSSFSIANANLEVGQEFATPASFSWATTNTSNLKLDTLAINFNGADVTLEAGDKVGSKNGLSKAITPVTKTTATTVSATISAQDKKGSNITKSANVSWQYPWYIGTSAKEVLTPDDAKTLTKKVGSSIKGTQSFTGSGYEYIVYPAVWGRPAEIKDPGGFNFAIRYLANITVQNAYGVDVDCIVLRSANFLNTATNMIIK